MNKYPIVLISQAVAWLQFLPRLKSMGFLEGEDREIARELHIRKDTIDSHIANIMRRHGVKRRDQLPGVTKPLTPHQQQTIDLYLAGRTFKEMSNEINTNIGTISHTIKRLRSAGHDLPYRQAKRRAAQHGQTAHSS